MYDKKQVELAISIIEKVLIDCDNSIKSSVLRDMFIIALDAGKKSNIINIMKSSNLTLAEKYQFNKATGLDSLRRFIFANIGDKVIIDKYLPLNKGKSSPLAEYLATHNHNDCFNTLLKDEESLIETFNVSQFIIHRFRYIFGIIINDKDINDTKESIEEFNRYEISEPVINELLTPDEAIDDVLEFCNDVIEDGVHQIFTEPGINSIIEGEPIHEAMEEVHITDEINNLIIKLQMKNIDRDEVRDRLDKLFYFIDKDQKVNVNVTIVKV